MNSLDHINQISQEIYGKQSYTLTLTEISHVIDIFQEERAQGRYLQDPLGLIHGHRKESDLPFIADALIKGQRKA